MNIPTQELINYAVTFYDVGGHWLVETFEASDWEGMLEDCDGNLAQAKVSARKLWEFRNEQNDNARF